MIYSRRTCQIKIISTQRISRNIIKRESLKLFIEAVNLSVGNLDVCMYMFIHDFHPRVMYIEVHKVANRYLTL